jgi:adenosylcobyric acid synthase
VAGLGYLPVTTRLTGDKRVAEVIGQSIADGAPFTGYEIHAGRTSPLASVRPLLRLADGQIDGTVTTDGRIAGCYIHRLFDHPAQRAAWLGRMGAMSDGVFQSERIDQALDELAEHLAHHVDVDRVLAIAKTEVRSGA